MNESYKKPYPYWAAALFLPFLSFLVLYMSLPHYVLFQCDRNKKVCTIERWSSTRTETEFLPISYIKYAHYDPYGGFVKGYHGPEIKLKDGNDISIGAGSKSPSEEKKTVDEINLFLTDPEKRNLSITQTGVPSAYLAGMLFIGGLFFLYKEIRLHYNRKASKA
ncbi:MAG: hypothetical protein C0402_16475 [Thermodesulfovibrio sp.]|nr:hypothetical protein [Thermodesulfovibrio sp.]